MAQQGPPPRRPAPLPASGWPEQPVARRHAAGYGSQDPGLDDDLESGELPPWAGLSISPRRPGRESRPPREDWASGDGWPQGDGYSSPGYDDDFGPAGPGEGQRPRRAVAARARKARRKIYTWGGVAIAVAVIAAGAVHLMEHKAPAARHGNFVTSYQPGDFRSVPNACRAVTAATLNQYLPGSRARAVSASLGSSRSDSQCTWTLDARPLYRVLEVSAQALGPSLVATGNGSATNNAIDSYDSARQGLANPPKKSHLPKAAITDLAGLGGTAFSALQVIKTGADRTDLVTVVTRDHNVLVTVELQGLDHSSRGGYGPVSVPQLRTGALAAARDLLTGLH